MRRTLLSANSGWLGDNLLEKSDNTNWQKGMDTEYGKESPIVTTSMTCRTSCTESQRTVSAPMRMPMRMPISGIYRIKGVGDVLAGRTVPSWRAIGSSPFG